MPEAEFHPTLFNPFMLWTDLAMKTTEMVVSSGQVIGERVDELTRASAHPSQQDYSQLTLLAPERVKGATETALETFTRLQTTGWQFMANAWQQWFSTLAAMTTITGSRTFGQVLERQDRLYKSLTRAGADAISAANDAAVDATPKAARGATTAAARRSSRVSRARVAAPRR